MIFDDDMASDSFLSESDRRDLERDAAILEGDSDYEDPEFHDYLDEWEQNMELLYEDDDEEGWWELMDEEDQEETPEEITPIFIDAEEISPPYLVYTDM